MGSGSSMTITRLRLHGTVSYNKDNTFQLWFELQVMYSMNSAFHAAAPSGATLALGDWGALLEAPSKLCIRVSVHQNL